MEEDKLVLPFLETCVVLKCPFASVCVICANDAKMNFLCDKALGKDGIRECEFDLIPYLWRRGNWSGPVG